MKTYQITFAASGVISIEAESEAEARKKFDTDPAVKADAAAMLSRGGIDITDVTCDED